ncbi:MAG: hypothetical protein AB7P03_28410, partial [Kofleriaceae bacterium]
MRFSLAALVLAPSIALAGPAPPPVVIWDVMDSPARPDELSTISHKLFLNDCRPNGCVVRPGNNDSRTDQSTIVSEPKYLSPWQYDDAFWHALVGCVRDTFAPFNVDVVTADPGGVPHFEVMVGGHSRQLDPNLEAGGVAYLVCGATLENAIGFVFPQVSSDLEYLCGAVAQEIGHTWGLDHALDPADPMTYLDLGSLKRFQNTDAACGETAARPCYCGGNTQNSYQYLLGLFGPADLQLPAIEITDPKPYQWVLPGFPVRAEMAGPLGLSTSVLLVDNVRS